MSYQRCPICYGKGKVPAGFYELTDYVSSTDIKQPEICRACAGSGVLMTPDIAYPQKPFEITCNRSAK